MRIERLLCDRQSFIKSRAPLEDNAYVLSHYDNGAVGRLWCSSVNAGNMGSQRYRFVGSKASVEWTDSHPDQLIYEVQGEPGRVMHHGMPYLEEREPRRRPDGRAAHRGPRRQLGQHLPLDRPGDRREEPRRRGVPRRPTTIRASRPAPRACAGSRPASARPTRARSGSTTTQSDRTNPPKPRTPEP